MGSVQRPYIRLSLIAPPLWISREIPAQSYLSVLTMSEKGCTKCIKCWLFVFNLFVFVVGLVLLGFGIYIKIDYGDYIRFDSQTEFSYIHGANVLIGAGVLMAFVSFFGCFGSFKENGCMLITYAVFVFIIFAVEVIGGGLAYGYRSKLEKVVHTIFNETLKEEYGSDDNKGLTEIADKFMRKYKCCGNNNYKDWQRSTFSKGSHYIVPDNCCHIVKPDCGKFNSTYTPNIYKEGCWAEFKEIVTSNYALIGGLAIGVAVVLLHAAILAIVFSRKLNRAKTRSTEWTLPNMKLHKM